MRKVLARLHTMDILLGEQIGEPVAVLCNGPKTSRVWAGMVKLHLKHPELDGVALLHGTRTFAIQLDDNVTTIAKVAKSFDPLAPSSLLSVKFSSEAIRELDANQFLKEAVEDSFRRGLEYEITQAQKAPGESYGWLVTTSPDQLTKLHAGRIGVAGELLRPTITNKDNLSRDGVVKRNCLVLILKGLNLSKQMDEVTEALKQYLGEKNVASVYYPRAKPPLHNGVVNVECLNAYVYKQKVHKSARICGKWVEFQPHPNSLEGSVKPDEQTLKKLGFTDVNSALVNTVEALQNAPGPSERPLTKRDITTLVEDVITKENSKLRQEFKEDLTAVKNEICSEAQTYADKIDHELRGALANLEQIMAQSVQVVRSLSRPLLQAPQTPASNSPSPSAAALAPTASQGNKYR